MNFRIKYAQASLADVKRITTYLKEIHPDLPRRFRNSLAAIFGELDVYPERWPPNKNGIRAARLRLSKRLSYHLFYQLMDDTILVLRIIPQSADPSTWPT